MKDVQVYHGDVEPGAHITVWYGRNGHKGCGQGGTLVEWTVAGHIRLVDPLGEEHHFFDDTIDYVTAEVPYAPDECLEYGEHCRGPVDMVWAGGDRSWPRCTFHGERRLQRYEESIKDSDLAPSWLDESYAGERWDDE